MASAPPPSTLYEDAFAQARSPAHVFRAVDDRIQTHRALALDLVALVHDRIVAEQHYSQALERIEQRLHASSAKDALFRERAQLAVAPAEQDRLLGDGWSAVRRALEADVREARRAHDQWRTRVEADVERPLAQSLTRGDWAKWSAAQQHLAAAVSEYDALVDKVSKQQAKAATKSSAASKLLQAQSALAQAGSGLTSDLPPFLALSHNLDLAHAAFLKEALVRAGTLTADLGRERMDAGERIVNLVLAVDHPADAEQWALREGMKLSGGGGGAGLGTVGEFGETPAASAPASSRARTESVYDDAASTVSGATGVSRSRTTSRPASSAPPPPPAAPLPIPTSRSDAESRSTHNDKPSRASRFGGKLSSVFGGGGDKDKDKKHRDRSSSIPNSAKYATAAAASSSFQPEPDAPPVPVPVERRPSAISSSSLGSDLLSSGNYTGGQAPLQPDPAAAPGGVSRRKSLMPGGLFGRRASSARLGDGDGDGGAGAGSPSLAVREREDGASSSAAFGALSDEPAAMGGQGAGAREVDAEGFSVPPRGYDRAIGEGQGQARNLMDEDDDDEGMGARGTSIPKLSIAPQLATPSSPPLLPQESEQARLAALESVKNALGPAPSPSEGGLGRRATVARGRRGGERNTVYGGVPGAGPERADSALSASTTSAMSEDDRPLAAVVAEREKEKEKEKHRRAAPPPPTSAARAPAPAAAVAEAPLASPLPLSPTPTGGSAFSPSASFAGAAPGRAMSIMSASSSLHTAAPARPDPFAASTGPGLRVSVTETVNVLLKAGEVTRVMVVGEVGVSLRTAELDASKTVKLRLSGLDACEKSAPNAAYLASADGAGDFTLSPSFASTTQGATTPVLKYQLSSTLATPAVAPLVIKPTWRCEPGLARAIVTYGLSAQSPLATAELDDLRLDLVLASGTASAFQAKPATAALAQGGRALSFALDSATSGGPEGNKLLASLTTEGAAAAQPAPVSASWVVRGRTVGNVGVEVLEGAEGGVVELVRETRAGKYLAA
ncbi:hypothetical protein Rhopal_006879-T1 [Rhodotorula paludigena]|uniref:MHD domain-containing protein n=1 Tax=Rhodotorula paludigena TaxID=86838 RepID=A0AAV5GWE2_9BASI|nr:hypothetical protein Rhopal_006879-T1 [Rhodotorula paludigena]